MSELHHQPARVVSATVFLAAGLFWIGVAFKPEMLAWFSLGEPMWADLALAGLFIASGFMFLANNRNVKLALNILAAMCFAYLIAWGVFGVGKV